MKSVNKRFGSSSSGTAPADGIGRKTAGRESPDVFAEIEIDCDSTFLKSVFGILEIDPWNRRKLYEDRAAYHERSLGAKS